MKKLSQAQANVIDCLMQNEGSVIRPNQYYAHNRVVSKEPFMHKYGFETRELMSFVKPTLDVLIKIGAITKLDNGDYMLTPPKK